MRRKWDEANRDSIGVFFSEGQFQQQGDLRHEPASARPGEQFRDELRGRGLGGQTSSGGAHVRGRIDGRGRREQKRWSTRRNQPGRKPRLRKLRLRRRALPLPQGGKRAPNLRRDSAPEAEAKPPPLPFRLRPTLKGGS